MKDHNKYAKFLPAAMMLAVGLFLWWRAQYPALLTCDNVDVTESVAKTFQQQLGEPVRWDADGRELPPNLLPVVDIKTLRSATKYGEKTACQAKLDVGGGVPSLPVAYEFVQNGRRFSLTTHIGTRLDEEVFQDDSAN